MIIEIRLLLTPDETVISIIFLTLGKNVTFDTVSFKGCKHAERIAIVQQGKLLQI